MNQNPHLDSLNRPLHEKGEGRVFGGKGDNLLRLAEGGTRVLPAVGVVAAAFEAHLASSGAGELISALEDAMGEGDPDREALAEVRARLLETPVDSDLMQAIVEASAEWWRRASGAGVIVRSSATVEDSAHHSYAGIFESLRADRPGELETRVREVWASVFAPRAASYYQLSGLDRYPSMALILQPFVEAERSGVMFTRFRAPDGDARVLIEHVEGDCEKLVTGAANPDRLWISRWPSAETVEVDEGDAALLGVSEVAHLVREARRLEDLFGSPQDIEWCLRDGELFILQSRPITTVDESAPEGPSPDDRTKILTGVGASGGRAGGAAHLVFNVDDANALEAGQVLVTTMTNPDMVASMRRSSAVVTDVGGMICHAAIVSRELHLPCVVGTEIATATIAQGDGITVDGSRGAIYAGTEGAESAGVSRRLLGWEDLWEVWFDAAPAATPRVSSVLAIENLPRPIPQCVLDPVIDLTIDGQGRFRDFDRLEGTDELESLCLEYLERVERAAAEAGVDRVAISGAALGAAAEPIAQALAGFERLAPAGRSDDGAVPLASTLLPEAGEESAETGEEEGGPGVFGRQPAMREAPMPPAERRAPYFEQIPALARAHAGHSVDPEKSYVWLDLRPEVPITPMLKSVVLAGIETIPAALGFDDLAPLHVQWIRCRFHFRADTFQQVWMRLLQASWDGAFMSRLMRRVDESYERLEAAAAALPQTTEELAAASSSDLQPLFVVWWHAFVEFFVHTFFIQAQGDDGIYPYLSQIVEKHAGVLEGGRLPPELAIPGMAELAAPTSPVLTAEYLADLMGLREKMMAAGIEDLDSALAAIDPTTGEAGVRETYQRHHDDWHWMRERDPYYEPIDRPEAILQRALGVEDSVVPEYAANLERARLALSLHFDLAPDHERAARLIHAFGYGHALEIERENHHVVWLKASYPFRRLCLEWERRLSEVSALEPGDIFFLEAPEVLAALGRLPAPLDSATIERLRNRRAAYHRILRLQRGEEAVETVEREADYY